jgi:prepilin-type N-terminal cleavage/methylation domain-containing protein
MKKPRINAFTLIELLVVISIIAILAGIALPVFSQVQVKGAQTKALSNAKQIATALKLYAIDNNGTFPSTQTSTGTTGAGTPVTTSNDALCQLIPDYVPGEDIFWLTKSAWCSAFPNGPDNQIDNPMVSPSIKTLASGENEWAYVLNLNDTSTPSFPLLADGMADQASHTYVADQTAKGGVWKGKQAIVVHCDTSAVVAKVTGTTANSGGTVQGYNGGASNGDIFSTANGNNGWLGTTNTVVNPK